MKNKIHSLLAVAVVVLAAGSVAKGDTCAPPSCYQLTQENGTVPLGSYLPGANYGAVSLAVNSSGTSATITFQAASGWMFHNNGVGWNEVLTGGATISGESFTCSNFLGGATCPTTESGAQNMDGFKSFTNTISGLGTGSSAGVQTIVITITGTGLTLSDFENPNSTNTTFVALVSPFPNTQGCPTGFVGDSGSAVGINGNTLPQLQCGSSTTVPEPGTLALFGTGALGLAGFLRRKLFA